MTGSESGMRVGEALARVRAPIFLARETQANGRPLVSIHTTERKAASAILSQAKEALAAARPEALCRVVVHRPAALSRIRSLEGLLQQLGDGPIVFDPTHFVSRSSLICDFTARLRRALPEVIQNLFVDAARRTLFVVVHRGSYPKAADARLTARSQTLEQIAEIFGQWHTDEHPDFDLAIRVGFEPPSGAQLIAVDRVTAKNLLGSLVRRRALQGAAASLLGLATVVPAAAQEATTTPDPSLTIVARGGIFNPTNFAPSSWGSIGLKGTMPVGNAYGLMGEASIGTGGYLGAAGHVYWRDPNAGLIGGFASYETDNAGNRSRIGAEGHLYFNTLSAKAVAGYQQSAAEGNGFVGKLDLTFYATPDFSLTGGIGTDPLGTYGHAGFEWQTAMAGIPGMSVFFDGRFGSAAQNRVMGGLRVHFGGAGATLMDQQRMNSPDDALANPIASAVSASSYP